MAERRMKTIGGPKGTAVPGGGKGAALSLIHIFLLSGNHRELAAMIKGIFEVGQVRKGKGNRLAVRDEENMKRAQKLLYGELAAALGMHPDQMPAYIGKRLESPAVV